MPVAAIPAASRGGDGFFAALTRLHGTHILAGDMDRFARTKIAIGIAVVLLVVLVIVFRASIALFFNRGSRDAGGGNQETLGGLTVPSGGDAKTPPSLPVPSPQTAPVRPSGAFPPYRGRDPAEIRLDSKAAAGLSESQREELYKEIRDAARMLRDEPTFGQAWLQLGLLKKSIGDYEGARDAWEYASIVRPESFIPPANLAQIYWYYLPDYPRAEKEFREAIRRDANQPALYISLAEFYSFAYREKEPQADRVLREGIEANPQNVDVLKALGAVYERRGDYRSAVEWWEKALKLRPGDSAIQEKLKELRAKS